MEVSSERGKHNIASGCLSVGKKAVVRPKQVAHRQYMVVRQPPAELNKETAVGDTGKQPAKERAGNATTETQDPHGRLTEKPE